MAAEGTALGRNLADGGRLARHDIRVRFFQVNQDRFGWQDDSGADYSLRRVLSTRSSPTRLVTPVESRCSSSARQYFRLLPK